uniref:hypothetical protein n=1 Tax=Nocardioides sp. TaxID=35761 RepID=UPI002600D708
RIRAARRRRAGIAAVAAASVAVAGIAGLGALRDPSTIEPAGPVVVGVDVPQEVAISGFPYTLTSTSSLTEDHGLKVPESDQSQAVSLVASDLGSGTATLFLDGEAVARARGSQDLELPVPVGGGQRLRVEIDGAGPQARVGVAVYEATGELAPGVDNGTAVFRDSVADARLLTAAFAREGESQVTVSFRGRLSDVRFASYCTTQEKGLWLNVDFDGDGPITGPCRGTDSRDPGGSWSSFEDDGPAARHTVRAYVTRGFDGPEVDTADAEVGVGIYSQPSPTRQVQGMSVDTVVEYAGRTWQLDRVIRDGGVLDFSTTDQLLGFVAQGEMSRAYWEGERTRGGSAFLGRATGPASAMAGVLLRGERYEVGIVNAHDESVPGTLLIYRPV